MSRRLRAWILSLVGMSGFLALLGAGLYAAGVTLPTPVDPAEILSPEREAYRQAQTSMPGIDAAMLRIAEEYEWQRRPQANAKEATP